MSKYAQALLDQEGIYRAFPLTWTAQPSKQKDSKSVSIVIQFGIRQKWHPPQPNEEGEGNWSQPWPEGYYTYGRSAVIGRDGTPNAGAVEALSKAGLWDGDFDKLSGPPPSIFVHLDVKESEFNGKKQIGADWINPDAEKPRERGGLAPASSELLDSLRTRFGSATKAIAGGKPGGAPGAPPGGLSTPVSPTPAPAPAGVVPAQPTPAAQPATTPAAAPQPQPTPAPQPQPAAIPPEAAGLPPEGEESGDSSEEGGETSSPLEADPPF